MAIRFLSTIEKWKNFSNLSPPPIEIDGEVWNSVEHYYQYKKFENCDPSYAQKIKNTSSPRKVKKLSLENKTRDSNWKEKKVEILKKAVTKKFETYNNLKQLLLSTGQKKLIEANPDDYFWGEGKNRTGKKIIGKILMEIRDSFLYKN